jgi:hypothetical protein
MNHSAPLQNFEDIIIRPLAPVIPMKSVTPENNRLIRKVSKAKLEKGMPLFYNKPIYKSKKYDLL